MQRIRSGMASFHHTLMKCHLALQREVMAGAKKLGLTSGQPKILEYLTAHDGAEQKCIATHCEIESATVGNILSRMESMHLIERRRRDGNRRSIYIYLTDDGKRAAAAMERVFAAAEDRALCGLTADERAKICSCLNKIYANIAGTEV